MPRTLLIVQNASAEGPGSFARVLEENAVEFTLVDLEKGDAFPPPVDYGAVLVMGGPASANDTTPAMLQELSRIREALEADIPYLGMCLGMQCLAKAAGGAVRTMKEKEIGFRDVDDTLFTIELTPAGKEDPLLRNCESALPIFQLHGDAVELPEGMTLLGAGRRCTNQIVKAGKKAYGIQGHYELTEAILLQWLDTMPELQAVSRASLLADWTKLRSQYEQIGAMIFRNFLAIAGFVPLQP